MAQYNCIIKVVLVLIACYDLAKCRKYIISSSLETCNEEASDCLTLSQFGANSSQYLDSDTTLTLMEGNHSLNSHLSVRDTASFSMLSLHDLIITGENSLICFHNVSNIGLYNLKLRGCRLEISTKTMSNFLLSNVEVTNFTLRLFRTNASIFRAIFSQITVFAEDAIIAARESNVTITESLFDANSLSHDESVIVYNAFASEITVNSSTFKDNKASGEDSRIIFNEYSSHGVIIYNSTFYKNNASGRYAGILVSETSLTVYSSHMYNNINVQGTHGGAITIILRTICHVNIHGCTFLNNSAVIGGAIGVFYYQYSTTASISDSVFKGNKAKEYGGSLHIEFGATAKVSGCIFQQNYAHNGGAMSVYNIKVIDTCYFKENVATNLGGALYIRCPSGGKSQINVTDSNFSKNSALNGGAISGDDCQENPFTYDYLITINKCVFINNIAYENGGAMLMTQGDIEIIDNDFINNQASNGGAIYTNRSKLFTLKSTFKNNTAVNDGGALSTYYYYVAWSTHELLFKYSKILINYTQCHTNISECEFYNNRAKIGGAIYTNTEAAKSAEQSGNNGKVYITFGLTKIMNNTARNNGGGIHLYRGELKCQNGGRLMLLGNTANEDGGGIFSNNSSVSLHYNTQYNDYENTTIISFIGNKGKKGGALYLQNGSTMYILNFHNTETSNVPIQLVAFVSNSATYGKDVFVSDDNCTNCYVLRQCFFQLYQAYNKTSVNSIQAIYFSNTQNEINIIKTHFNLCLITVDQLEMVVKESENLKAVSNLLDDNIGSLSLRPCFCKGGRPDCNYTPQPIEAQVFSVKVALVDQFNHTKSGYIKIHIIDGEIPKEQTIQQTKESCTSFHFKVFSSRLTQELVMSPNIRDPYYVLVNNMSNITLPIKFHACNFCPIGFEKLIDEIKGCSCICDTALENYITSCNASIETVTKWHTTAWIGYIYRHNSSGYLIYPYCPLNYCLPPEYKVEMNLNAPSGADAQCVHDRTGLLCGACKRGLSLSLGSKRCLKCPTSWPGLLVGITVGAFLAGMFLVAILLILNLTVAVGTLNGLIFYVNIVGANSSTFFPSSSFIAIFIAWMNLDLGIDTCFFVGMDAYWKTWIELAFPTYVIFLLIMIIIISERSLKFARLIGRKNPVATLDTLILLSYVKFIRIIITSYSFAILDHPDQSREVVWLPDASISYFSGKHIILLIVATLILLVGIVYTTLLFFWQWLLRHQDKNMFRWILKYQRLRMFIEPYHAPYSIDHRYWTGLLLFVRIIVFTTSAVTVSIDPGISLLIITKITAVLLILMANRPYKTRRMDYLELISYANILCFSIATLYFSRKGQDVIAYISGGITLALFVIVFIYHIFTELISNTILGRHLKKLKWGSVDTDNHCGEVCSTLQVGEEKASPLQNKS